MKRSIDTKRILNLAVAAVLAFSAVPALARDRDGQADQKATKNQDPALVQADQSVTKAEADLKAAQDRVTQAKAAQQAARVKADKERAEKEQAEKAKAQKLAQEKAEKENADKLAQEKGEKDKAAKFAQDKAAQDKAAQDKAAQDKAATKKPGAEKSHDLASAQTKPEHKHAKDGAKPDQADLAHRSADLRDLTQKVNEAIAKAQAATTAALDASKKADAAQGGVNSLKVAVERIGSAGEGLLARFTRHETRRDAAEKDATTVAAKQAQQLHGVEDQMKRLEAATKNAQAAAQRADAAAQRADQAFKAATDAQHKADAAAQAAQAASAKADAAVRLATDASQKAGAIGTAAKPKH